MLDADHVVSVGVVAQEFDRVARERWRVAVLSRPSGKEPGPFAVEPPGADAAPLQQQLLDMRVVVEIEHDRPFGVVIESGVVHGVVEFLACFAVEGVQSTLGEAQHGIGAVSGGTLCVIEQLDEHLAALRQRRLGRVVGGERAVERSVHEPSAGVEPGHVAGRSVRSGGDEAGRRVAAGGVQRAFEPLLYAPVGEGGHVPDVGYLHSGVETRKQPFGDGVALVVL